MKRFPYYFLFLIALTVGHTTFGADTVVNTYTPLVGVPGLEAGKGFSTEQYVNALYYLSITVAGLLAVVQIIYGGVEWTFSDAFTEKSSAKTRIQGALLGLLIILSAVLILNTINPNLTILNIFGNAPDSGSLSTGSGGTTFKDANVGDQFPTAGKGAAEINHFKDTCPGDVQSSSASGEKVLICGARAPVTCTTVDKCDSLTEEFVGDTRGGCGKCIAKGALGDQAPFNYDDTSFTNGEYVVQGFKYDKADPSKLQSILENKCIPGMLSGPIDDGVNVTYTCTQ